MTNPKDVEILIYGTIINKPYRGWLNYSCHGTFYIDHESDHIKFNTLEDYIHFVLIFSSMKLTTGHIDHYHRDSLTGDQWSLHVIEFEYSKLEISRTIS